MTSQRTFFYVTVEHGQRRFAVFHDNPMPARQAKHDFRVEFRYELTGTPWAGKSLAQLEAEYLRRFAAGTLPPSNMTPPRPPKRKEGVSHEFKRSWRTGDCARDLREKRS